MNIRITDISLDASRMPARSTVLNPAVRMVTDWKKAFITFPPMPMPSAPRVAGLFHSSAR